MEYFSREMSDEKDITGKRKAVEKDARLAFFSSPDLQSSLMRITGFIVLISHMRDNSPKIGRK